MIGRCRDSALVVRINLELLNGASDGRVSIERLAPANVATAVVRGDVLNTKIALPMGTAGATIHGVTLYRRSSRLLKKSV